MFDNMIGYQADKNIKPSQVAHCNQPTQKGKNGQTISRGVCLPLPQGGGGASPFVTISQCNCKKQRGTLTVTGMQNEPVEFGSSIFCHFFV